MAARIETVAVVGGEIVGWSVAAALKRRLPYLDVALVPAAGANQDPANRLISTLPSIVGFHEDIGLSEADTIARARSGIRLGTRFAGWVDGLEPYIHAYGAHGRSLEGAAFHQLWLRAREREDAGRFHDFSVEAVLGQTNRVPDRRAGSGSENLQFALQIDRGLYLSMMTAYARHLGVRTAVAPFASARLRPDDGFVDAVVLEDGSELPADLFVDCSGPSAAVRSQLGGESEDWSHYLPCDRILLGEAQPEPQLPTLDTVEAIDIGWRWKASSPRSVSVGIAFDSDLSDTDAAARQLESAGGTVLGDPVVVRAGQRREPWLRNCVAVGAAAVAVEPLEWTNLHLVHSAVDRIITMMPGRDCAPIELSEYNRQCTAEAERVRDFLCLHYATSNRAGSFWERAREVALPPSLAHTLALFQERGRLPFYEEETFSRDSWLSVLIGQGIFPRRFDPLVETIDPALARQTMSRVRDMVARAVQSLPNHEIHLRTLFQQAAR